MKIGSTASKKVTDKPVKAMITLSKQDAETGSNAQGDATLEGAVYGLFAREDIIYPDGTTGVLHKKNTQVATLTIDKNTVILFLTAVRMLSSSFIGWD